MDAVFKLAAIYSVVDKLTGPVKKMSGSVLGFEKMMNKANGMQNFGAKMGLGAAAVSVAANQIKSSIMSLAEPYMRIEEATAQLHTVTTSTMGSMKASLKASQQAAIEWSNNHTDTAESYIKACTSMASAGLNDTQAIAGTSSALALAKANMGEAGSAAQLLAQLYNNMGDKTRDANKEMTHLSDIMTKTMQLYQIKDLGALGEGLAEGMASAKNYRVSVEELNVVIGQLNNLGIKGSSAGTTFSATLRQMNKASQELGFEIARTSDGGINLTQTIENIKNKYGAFANMTQSQQMAFQSAFGDEGLKGIGLLMDQTDSMKQAMQGVTGAAGETAKALAILEDTGAARMQIAINKLEAMKMQFGEKILGNKKLMDEILPGLMNNVEWLGNLAAAFMETHPVMTQNIVLFTVLGGVALGILAPIMLVAGGMVSLAGTALGAIVKIGKGFKWLYTMINTEAFVLRLAAIKVKLVSTFMAGRAAVIRCMAAMQTFILSLWRASAAAATAGAQGIKRMTLSLAAMARQAATTAVIGLRSLTVSLGQASRTAAVAALQGLRSMTMALAAMARQAIVTAVSALVPLIAAVWSFTVALLANPITWIVIAIIALGAAVWWLIQNWNNLSSSTQMIIAILFPLGAAIAWLANNWDTVGAAAQYAWAVTVSAFQSGLAWIQTAINGALAWVDSMVTTFFTSGAALWGAFTNGIQSAISGPVEAVRSGLQQIRNMLPFSDAKEGPLSQLTHNGSKLMTTIAEGVELGAPTLQKSVQQSFAGIDTPEVTGGSFFDRFKGVDGKFSLSGIFNGQAANTPDGEKATAKPAYHFHFNAGAITIKSDNMDNADSVMAVFKQLATEVGAD